jgi:hypothetical protein
MKTGLIYKLPCVLAVVTLSYVASASASVLLYDDLEGSSDLGINFNTGSAEVGNDITFANAIPTEFDLQYWFSSSIPPIDDTANMQVRMYDANGPVISGSASPGTEVYDSGVFSMENPVPYAPPTTRAILQFGLGAGNGNALNLLPGTYNELICTVQITGLQAGESAGVTLYDPATTGGNFGSYWQNTGTGWTLQQNDGPADNNFGQQLYGFLPVPEPATMGVVGGLGLLIMMVRRRLA